MTSVVDIYLIYSFIRRLTTPFEKMEAFRLGVIDKDGEILVPKSDRSYDQDKAFGYFDRLVLNLKKLLAKVPGGRSRLATYGAALYLIKEGQDIDHEVDINLLTEKLEEYTILMEDAPTMSAGGGFIAGIGIGPDGEPGVHHNKKKRKKKDVILGTIKRKDPK
jgi:hypothetical protein